MQKLKEHHTKAAEHHEHAAKHHRKAAEHHGSGKHNTRRRLTMRMPRTVISCTRCITLVKQQSVTSSCTGTSKLGMSRKEGIP